MNKAQFQFAWIFAVIVGAFILFLAFYFVGTTLMRQQYQQATIEAQSLDIIMSPFSPLGAIGATTHRNLTIPRQSELIIECEKETLSTTGSSIITINKKRQQGIPKDSYDKYIFSEKKLETTKLSALSKPIEMPWRVADIIILWPANQNYCFINAPYTLEKELGNMTLTSLNIHNFLFVKRKSSCPDESIKICFSDTTSGCDTIVRKSSYIVKKKGQEDIYFSSNALMLAAIISDPDIYNCNVQRLASRINAEAEVYETKAINLLQRNCQTSFNLFQIKQASEDLFNKVSRENLLRLEQEAENLETVNKAADCQLF